MNAFRHSLLILLAACVATPVIAEEESAPLLRVVDDESSLERQVRTYIKDLRDVDASFRYLDDEEQDLVLVYGLNPDGDAPSFQIYVDTMISARDETGILERCFKIYGYYILDPEHKTPELRARILEYNNTYMQKRWMPHRIIIDKDGDIQFESFVNIPHKDVSVHAALIDDVLVRNVSAWRLYYEGLAEILDL